MAKSFNILATSLSVLHNYFDSLNKIIFKSVIAKFLNTSTKSFFFFSCKNRIGFYLFFTDLNSSIKIHNQNIENAFKDFILSVEDYSMLLTDRVHIQRIS